MEPRMSRVFWYPRSDDSHRCRIYKSGGGCSSLEGGDMVLVTLQLLAHHSFLSSVFTEAKDKNAS